MVEQAAESPSYEIFTDWHVDLSTELRDTDFRSGAQKEGKSFPIFWCLCMCFYSVFYLQENCNMK